MTSSTLPYWLAANYLSGIGPRKFLKWFEHFSNIKNLFQTSTEELKLFGLSAQHIHAIQNVNWQLIEADVAWANGSNHHLIAYDDDDYPLLLKEIADPPLVLYLRGNKTILKSMQLAIVGSRHATPAGLVHAKEFAHALAETGFTITSGLALGIDGASHRGALAAKGKTIGVGGTGLKHVYPASHRSLIDEMITTDGAVISEFPLTMPPLAPNFPRRNRIISGLCIGVLVVEAALKSGSLITARCALEQGREVFAIPGSIRNPLVRGCHYLIRQGATLVEKVDDIFTELSAFCSVPQTTQSVRSRDSLDTQAQQLLEKIEYEITPMDVIILRSALTTSELSSMLLALELKGYIRSVAGGYIRVA